MGIARENPSSNFLDGLVDTDDGKKLLVAAEKGGRRIGIFLLTVCTVQFTG